MPTYPDGVIVRNVVLPPIVDAGGNLASGTLVISPSIVLKWAATSQLVLGDPVIVPIVDGTATVPLPIVQTGFVLASDILVDAWTYTATVQAPGVTNLPEVQFILPAGDGDYSIQLVAPTEILATVVRTMEYVGIPSVASETAAADAAAAAEAASLAAEAASASSLAAGSAASSAAAAAAVGNTNDTINAALIANPASATAGEIAGQARAFTQTQTFDKDEGFQVGSKLKVTETIGFAGHRMHVTGQADGDMPYIEVVPTTKTGTDPGGSVAGIQVYNTLFGGVSTAPEREFIALEAKGDLYSGGRMFRLGTWASGDGQYLKFRIGIGDLNVVDFTSDGVQGGAASTAGQIELLSKTRIYSLGATIDNLIDFQRGTSFKALRAVVANAAAAQGAKVFLGRTRGSIGTPTNLASSDRMGGIEFGSYDTVTTPGAPVSDATEATTAYVRALTRESYSAFPTARGSQLDFGITLVGSTTLTDAVRLADPTANDEVAMFVLVNRAGTKTLSRVSIGAADSAGAGFRQLRVPN